LGERGYAFDLELGVFAVRRRFYGPFIARWTSLDPNPRATEVNLYTYAANIPVLLDDSSGARIQWKHPSLQIGEYPTASKKWWNLRDDMPGYQFIWFHGLEVGKAPKGAKQMWLVAEKDYALVLAKPQGCPSRKNPTLYGGDIVSLDEIPKTDKKPIQFKFVDQQGNDWERWDVCTVKLTAKVTVGFDDQKEPILDAETNVGFTAKQAQRMLNNMMAPKMDFKYTYTFRNSENCRKCLLGNLCLPGLGVEVTDETLDTPWYLAENEDSP
jgi:RHS repeat-associated protein